MYYCTPDVRPIRLFSCILIAISESFLKGLSTEGDINVQHKVAFLQLRTHTFHSD